VAAPILRNNVRSTRLFSRTLVQSEEKKVSPYEQVFQRRAKVREEFNEGPNRNTFQAKSNFRMIYITAAVFAWVFYKLGFEETDREKLSKMIEKRNEEYEQNKQQTESGQIKGDLEITHVVFFEIEHDNKSIGKIYIGLFGNVVPRTVENFIEITKRTKEGYKSTPFHRIIQDFMIQGGDTTRGNGSGGSSIYGSNFPDENFLIPHFEYCVSMANRGPNTNGSQFFITTGATSWLDGKHVVFGKIVDGIDVVDAMENVPTDSKTDRPLKTLKIRDCGVVPLSEFAQMQKQVQGQPEGTTAAQKKAKSSTWRPGPLPVKEKEEEKN
jgi:cyclophilin family peptidyl-prolyl cis-trans isomerase